MIEASKLPPSIPPPQCKTRPQEGFMKAYLDLIFGWGVMEGVTLDFHHKNHGPNSLYTAWQPFDKTDPIYSLYHPLVRSCGHGFYRPHENSIPHIRTPKSDPHVFWKSPGGAAGRQSAGWPVAGGWALCFFQISGLKNVKGSLGRT